jgi:hypothetical protein
MYSTDSWWSAAIILGIPIAFLLTIVSNQLMSPLPDSLMYAYIPNFVMFGIGTVVFIGAFIGRAYRVPVLLTIGSVIYRMLACACFAYLVVTIRTYLSESFISRSGDTMIVSYIVCIPTFLHAGAAMWVMGTSSPRPRITTIIPLPIRIMLRPRDVQLLPA